MHAEGERFLLGLAAEATDPGVNLMPNLGRIHRLIQETRAATILDYGSGKGRQYEPQRIALPGAGEWDGILDFWDVDEVRCYDPCYEPYSRLTEEKFDGVVWTDVLEHCPEQDMRWIVNEIFSFATRFAYAAVACYPAKSRLPNGENAHCTVHPPQWWRALFEEIAADHPGVRWMISFPEAATDAD